MLPNVPSLGVPCGGEQGMANTQLGVYWPSCSLLDTEPILNLMPSNKLAGTRA